MKKFFLSAVCLILGLTGFVFGQIKTITNADLEKYRQKRLQAEREYLENYARLGLPSPAELEAQREQSARERTELSMRLEREQLEREINSQRHPIYVIQNVTVNQRRTSYPYFYFPYRFFYFRNPPIRNENPNNQIPPIRPPQPIRSPFMIKK